MRNKIALTEQGEGQLTAALLLDVMASCIHHSLACVDFESPTCAYICSTLNLLGSQGLIEVRPFGKPPGAGKPSVDTRMPPSFITEAFKDSAEDKGDAPAH